ncbi:hypothetical protein ACQPZF_17835 [Actinosynnema sp. CS-041913]|uniref:hypothetical protein n=1 Tax=Actinosynnema sp. CS-041913 TaxID=3239917 RepID=UPI003D8D0F8F
MSAHRTRGLLRAAVLLAVGASPLLVGAASATEQPLDVVDGKLPDVPKVDSDAAKQVPDLLSGRALKLPVPPLAPLPAVPGLPGASELPTAPQARDLPAGVQAPAAPELPGVLDLQPPNLAKPALPTVSEPAESPLRLPKLG